MISAIKYSKTLFYLFLLIILTLSLTEIAYQGKSKNRLAFFCQSHFQSHRHLRILLVHVKYIQLQRKSNSFYGLTIKNEKDSGIDIRTKNYGNGVP